jgi:hypothetical protein
VDVEKDGLSMPEISEAPNHGSDGAVEEDAANLICWPLKKIGCSDMLADRGTRGRT